MEPAYSVVLETEPKANDINAITLALLAYNKVQSGGSSPKYLVITVRDEAQAIVGGLVGLIYLNWLHIAALWMQEELRGQGYGNSLLSMAEAEANKAACTGVCLETLSFQAPAFYEKRGYEIFAELPNFAGGKKYYLSKFLGSNQAVSKARP